MEDKTKDEIKLFWNNQELPQRLSDQELYLSGCNKFLTRSLFMEFAKDKDTAKFTLQEHDVKKAGNTYKSLRKMYLEHRDPTEYKFAKSVFGSWDHWQTLSKSPFFVPHLEKWREELEIMLRSEGINLQVGIARGGERGAESAARWLAEKGWEKSGPGRPTKKRIEREARVLTQIGSHIDQDFERMGLN